jgi:hypothetical protein
MKITIFKKVSSAIILAVFLAIIGIFYYHYTEGWSYVDSSYFTIMTLTTIRYGDLVPTQDSTKIFTSFYAIFGIGIMLYLVITLIKDTWQNKECILRKFFRHYTNLINLLNQDFQKAKIVKFV